MDLMYAVATRLLDGKQVVLDKGVELSVTASLSSPAAGMSGVFPLEENPGRLGQVLVYGGGRLLFSGRVDSQRYRVSGAGRVLELEARSKGALLLDNEAQPCVLAGVTLTALFSRVAGPYGFALYNPNPAFVLGSYTIRKDVSEWEALCGYTRRAYGVTPYLQGDTIYVGKPDFAETLRLCNTGAGTRFLSVEERYQPYQMLGSVTLRDSFGDYSATVTNSAAAYHGVRRQRYVIPANEFVDEPGLDANQRIKRSMRDSEGVAAVLPGLVEVRPGQAAEVSGGGLGLYNLMAEEVQWRQRGDGLVTRLELVNWMYY